MKKLSRRLLMLALLAVLAVGCGANSGNQPAAATTVVGATVALPTTAAAATPSETAALEPSPASTATTAPADTPTAPPAEPTATRASTPTEGATPAVTSGGLESGRTPEGYFYLGRADAPELADFSDFL